jgi:CO/xanthine dehydrogenase Mo-binding subunit
MNYERLMRTAGLAHQDGADTADNSWWCGAGKKTFAGGYYRPKHVHRAEIGLGGQGEVLAWQHRIVGHSILTDTPFEPVMVKDRIDAVTVERLADTSYAAPLALDLHHPKQNVPALWWRSVGHTHTAFVRGRLADEVATARISPATTRAT